MDVICIDKLYIYDDIFKSTPSVWRHNAPMKPKMVQKGSKVLSKISANWMEKRTMGEKDKRLINDILKAIWKVSESNLEHAVLETISKNLATVQGRKMYSDFRNRTFQDITSWVQHDSTDVSK